MSKIKLLTIFYTISLNADSKETVKTFKVSENNTSDSTKEKKSIKNDEVAIKVIGFFFISLISFFIYCLISNNDLHKEEFIKNNSNKNRIQLCQKKLRENRQELEERENMLLEYEQTKNKKNKNTSFLSVIEESTTKNKDEEQEYE